MNILLLGSHGQVGWELQRSLSPLGDVMAVGKHVRHGSDIDLAQPDSLVKLVRELKPAVIVNAAAYTAVDRAEEERALSWRVNAETPGILAEVSRQVGALLVHYSTDYVFSGEGDTPWRESDIPAPINHYGAGKLAGEEAISTAGGRHLIFRISWIHAPRGRNFVLTMLRLLQERDALAVVSDQIGAPTSAELVADITAQALRQVLDEPGKAGTYHLAATGETSWHGYSRYIAQHLSERGLTVKVMPEAVPTAHFPTAARRPANSRLDISRLMSTFDLNLPSWQRGVGRTLDECLEHG
ncbi:dTDP-4-dehydrorhamnose reductase [Aidingimonas lacisalsi]|uniref:dTDP-4-dehydrorhamnose reductase n=1 Tax=Aidingimonas lacisalsi TaxID=2604086 RepID=UPI0011D27B9B|nr:dTDP-4-dehydrorhamnose reductase [Aidingimonas lacisalsi]